MRRRGSFSDDADLHRGKLGTWFCGLHLPDGARDEARRRLAPLDPLARGVLVAADEARVYSDLPARWVVFFDLDRQKVELSQMGLLD